MKRFHLFGSITKAEEQDDGTVVVTGIASTESTDSDGEVITAAAMKAALPDYMKFANIREMHDAKKAAGTALTADVNDNGQTEVTAHVVDPIAVKKVLTGVYKGFSIGGKVKKRDQLNKTIITELSLSEISLVDRPANPDAVFSCFKAEGAEAGEAEGEEAETEVAAPAVEAAAEEAPAAAEPAAEEPAPAEAAAATVDSESAAEEAPKESAETVEAVINGETVSLRKRADGSFEVVQDTIAKGCYSISRLADLADSLRYFADSLQWDANTGNAPQEIPGELRDAARALYATLLKLVSHDVEQALAQLQAASENAAMSTKAQGLDDIAKAVGVAATDDVSKAVNDLLSKNQELSARVAELEALPAAPKGALRVVEKADAVEDALSKAIDDETLPPEQRALAAITKAHQGGGARIFS